MSGSEEGSGEKTHEATPRRLEKAREEGEFPRSQDAQSLAAYLGLGIVMVLAGQWAVLHLGTSLIPFLDRPSELAEHLLGQGQKPAIGTLLARLAAPLMLVVGGPAVMILALLIVQRGIVVVPKRILPKLSRISPVANAGNKYGPRGLVEFAKSTVKLTALITILTLVMWAERTSLSQYVWIDARATGMLLDQQFRLILTGVLVVATALAFFDMIWQRMDHLKRMRMTHEEMKEEGKQTEGDPHLRAQRRERGRQIATNRMLLAVPEADVVITNPLHYAVALKWDRPKGGSGASGAEAGSTAPICIVKGVDEIAFAIRARATEAGVPLHPDPPTARSLHALVEIGDEIAPEHYRAVAAAILFAEKIRAKAIGRDAPTKDRPTDDRPMDDRPTGDRPTDDRP